MPGIYHWKCCCGKCPCVEAEGVGSPPSYRLQIGALTVNTMSCIEVYNPATDQNEYYTVEGTFDGLDVCMFADITALSYLGSVPVSITVKKWLLACEDHPVEVSDGCLRASLTIDPGTDSFTVLVYLANSPTPPNLPDADWVVAVAGPFPAHSLPAGWCVDGFTKAGTVPTFDGGDPYSYNEQAWATTGGGTLTLTPCCKPQSTCVPEIPI